ncbi:MAG: spondin domain-containing protein [Pseudomonadota bacterium]
MAGSASAAEITVRITNLTQGMAFTPRLLVAHNENLDLFEPGQPAGRPLAWVAEAGVIADAQNPASAGSNFEYLLELPENADNNAWQAFGLGGPPLPPATESADYTFDTEDFEFLSLVTMLIPTNDAFAGLDSWRIPTEPGTYTVTLNAYDSGTEANDEISSLRTDVTEEITGLPLGGYAVPGMAGSGNPSATDVGTGGTGVAIQIENGTLADDLEGTVHIHRNVLGDTDPNGGISDLDSRVHRWLNPVARLTVIVN